MDTAVLTVGTMSGGDAVNITSLAKRGWWPSSAASATPRNTAIQEVRRICKGIGIAFDCDIEVELEEGYALQYNDPAMIDLVNKAVTAAYGKAEFIDKPLLRQRGLQLLRQAHRHPLRLYDGRCLSRGENAVSLHNGKIVFNEEVVMKHGVTGLAAIAMEYLEPVILLFVSSQIGITEAGDLHSRPPASHYSSTGSASREQYRRVSISRPVYGATMPSTRGARASAPALTSRPSVSHASPTPL